MPDRSEGPTARQPGRPLGLAAVNRELEQRCRESEAFVDAVAHDLRGPVVNLAGFCSELRMLGDELTLQLADDRIPADVREHGLSLVRGEMAQSIDFIQSSVRRLGAMVESLLRLARLGRVEYQWQTVDVAAVVADVLSSLAATVTERRATIQVAALPSCWGDPTAVEQVFANLISNALNYLDPQRPGVIEVGWRSATPPDAAAGDAAVSVYFVKDNGLGIPEGSRSAVFLPFRRMHPEAAPGEGIGLALVRRTVERLGGRIWFDSETGRGTTFFVTLAALASRSTVRDVATDPVG
jgi:signal transduction histidine kinase